MSLLFFFSFFFLSLKEMSLVAPESPSEQARRIFQTFDPEGKTFSKEHFSFVFKKELQVCHIPQISVGENTMKAGEQTRETSKDGCIEWRCSNSMKNALDRGFIFISLPVRAMEEN